ncbi:MAG: integrin alpha [bacterium]|nr:integrin alpha [bacterium]MBU1917155.1 integrin alpha [bacterium]
MFNTIKFFTISLFILLLLSPSIVFASDDAYEIITTTAFETYAFNDTGDIDGDNIQDILIGIPKYNDDATENGKTFLFLGKDVTDNVLELDKANYVFSGEVDYDHAGSYVMFLDDEDGDGFDEVLIGFGDNEDEQTILSSELADYAQTSTVAANKNVKYGSTTIYMGVGKTLDCTLNKTALYSGHHNGSLFMFLAGMILILLGLRIHAKE